MRSTYDAILELARFGKIQTTLSICDCSGATAQSLQLESEKQQTQAAVSSATYAKAGPCGMSKAMPLVRRHRSTWELTDIAPGSASELARTGDASVDIPRKEVIQPHLPVRLPCYDFTPVTDPTLDSCLPSRKTGWPTGFKCCRLPWCDGRCVQGPGTYSPRCADPRLLATPASCRRVAACNPNWDRLWGIGSASRLRDPLYRPL